MNKPTCIETDCTVKLGGGQYAGEGAFVSPKHIVAYLGKDGQLQDWHGKRIGMYWITATWKTPRSWVSERMHQIMAACDGAKYTGRSAGVGMIFKGKARKANL